jgi:hypothetical protein
MEYIGRSLVYAILVFSILLAVLGIGVFTNQIDWAGAPPPNQVEGIYAKNLKDIQARQEDFVRLRRRWKTADDTLAALEAKRDVDQRWYKEQVAMLRTGNDARGQEVPDPVKALTYEADGRLKLDGNQRPVFGKNTDERLTHQKALDDQLTKINEQIAKEIEQIHKLLKEEEGYTLQLLGEAGKSKGLLALLEQSLKDKQNALKELEAARQEAINGRVSMQVLLARQKQLQTRVKELKDFLAAQAARQPK